MSAIPQVSPSPAANRRRRVRQKVHAPAYATFVNDRKADRDADGPADSETEMLNLYEVLDISEVGVAIQGTSPMQIDQQVDLCLDLAEASGSIVAPARVVWSDDAGRVGFGLSALPAPALHRLREWLFLNSMAGAANAASYSGVSISPSAIEPSAPKSDYSDSLAAASAVQREAESLADLDAVLQLIASRSQSLLKASGAAIALTGNDPSLMVCRASAGQSAPPVAAELHVGSGFSGECVRTGKLLRCDDAGTDERVDRQSCRALGIRSILAAPIISNEKVVGLLEVFSPRARAFGEKNGATLQRFAETIASSFAKAKRTEKISAAPTVPAKPFSAPLGSVLFASDPARDAIYKDKNEDESLQAKPSSGAQDDHHAGIRLPRTYLYLLIVAAATIALVLGFLFAPSIQHWVEQKVQAQERSGKDLVQSSSAPSSAELQPQQNSSLDPSNVAQLRAQADHGDAAAQNAMGLLYAVGDQTQSIKQDEGEAARWFTKSAENGNVSAQYKLGLLYWGGHGVPKDINKAYFWAVLARAGGQEGSKDLAKVLANGMTRAQSESIEQQAEIWYQQHEPPIKPQAGH